MEFRLDAEAVSQKANLQRYTGLKTHFYAARLSNQEQTPDYCL